MNDGYGEKFRKPKSMPLHQRYFMIALFLLFRCVEHIPYTEKGIHHVLTKRRKDSL